MKGDIILFAIAKLMKDSEMSMLTLLKLTD